MAKGNKTGVKLGNKAAETGLDQNSALSKRAMSLQDTLEPQIEADINNPQGFGSNDLAAMNTAAQQSAGGSTAGLTGQAIRSAARTRNRGAFTAAADQAARSGAAETSQRGVEIQGANARLKAEQRAAALRAKQGLFGTDLSSSLQALGLVPGGVKAANEAEGPGLLDWVTGLSKSAADAGRAATGFRG